MSDYGVKIGIKADTGIMLLKPSDSNFHTIITHSSYQMYIVLTFDSLFIVYMLTYVLTKFNTALGQ
jgi:hypothetical protein